MRAYFNLSHPDSERLMGDGSEMAPGLKAQIEITSCPITSDHINGRRRISPLFIQVRHNRRDEAIIWSWGINGTVVHRALLEEFEQEGFTGYQTNQATVRFLDGFTSTDYREFLVTGWAGAASSDSGIQLDKSCLACNWKHYTGFNNVDKVIDWEQWTGEDFFIVWPLPLFTLVTERVAQWLLSRKIKSFSLKGLEDRSALVARYGYTPGRLSDYLPMELAIKYGKPLDIE